MSSPRSSPKSSLTSKSPQTSKLHFDFSSTGNSLKSNPTSIINVSETNSVFGDIDENETSGIVLPEFITNAWESMVNTSICRCCCVCFDEFISVEEIKQYIIWFLDYATFSISVCI